jgi:signal transduction histidine kinase
MKEAIEFFGHASALATKDLRLAEVGIEAPQILNFNSIILDVVPRRQDGRISSHLCPITLPVKMERGHAEDLVIEILCNAMDFIDAHLGRVIVRTAKDQRYARLDIEDNGPGIHPGLRPHLFKHFKRYPEGRMGFGLAYCRAITKAYDGDISEIGKAGEGAHFVVRIPLAESEGE